jgi:hypothetical protein
MPSVSKKQHNLMAMVANDPAKAKQLGIPQSVGAEFVKADKGRKFGSGTRPDIAEVNKPKTDHGKMNMFKKGGMTKMKHDDLAEDKKLIKKAFGMHDKQLHEKKKTDLTKLKGGGMTMKMAKKPTMATKRPGIGASTTPTKGNMGDVMMSKGGRTAAKGMHPVQKQSKRGAIDVKMCGGGMMKKKGK